MGRRSSTRALPAVFPAIVFAAGVAWAPAPGFRVACVATAAGALAAGALFARLRSPAVLILAAALGAGWGAADRRGGFERARGWLPEGGSAYEGRLVGVVRRAPERGLSGELRLTITVRPFPDPAPGTAAARVLLIVPGGSAEERRRLEALRAGDGIGVWARAVRPRVGSGTGRDATAGVKSARLVERWGPRGGSLPDRALAFSRGRLDRAIGREGPVRAFLGAVLLGDRASLDAGWVASLRASGLYHLVAISGLHTGFVAAAVMGLVVPLRLRGARAALVAGIAIAFFAAITGGAPPVARAAGVAMLGLLGRAIGAEGDPRNSLAVVAAAILVVRPDWVWNAGYLLSVAAVAAILTLAPAASRAIPLPGTLAKGLGISLAAYVGTAPLLASAFGRLAPVAVLANLVAVPVAAWIVASGILCVVFADLPILGAIAAASARGSIAMLLATAEVSASLPFAGVRVPAPSPVVLAIYGGGAILLATTPPARTVLRRGAAGVLAVALAALHLGPPPGSREGPSLTILDVGQGLAVAVVAGDGTCALVDAGGTGGGRFDAGDRVVVPRLLAAGCRRIDPLVVSHGHDDHAGGVAAVIEGLDVGEVWIPVGATRDEGLRGVTSAWGAALRLAERGTERRRGSWRIRVLHPGRGDRGLPINDRGLAVLLEGPEGARALLPGDLESRGERTLLERRAVPHADVLVAGHHGARGSSGRDWLAAVAPKIAVVSSGEGNRFGHPHPEALTRLREAGAAVYRTDLDGEIALRPTSSGWRVAVTARRAGKEPG